MDRTTKLSLKFINDWLEQHPVQEDDRDYSKYDPLTRIFIDPVGVEREKYNIELNRINVQLAKEERLDNVYLDMAEALSKLSYAERAKVGCLIVNEGGQIVSQGYNGTPSGFDNCCEDVMTDGDNAHMITKHEVLHAESNAISKCAKWGGSTDGATLYVTMSPCFECAKLIIQAGIKRVVYKELYRDCSGIDLLDRAGIEVNRYENRKQVIE